MEIAGIQLEALIGLGVLALGALAYGLKKYQAAMADGKITLSELIAIIEDPETASHAEDIESALKEVKKSKKSE